MSIAIAEGGGEAMSGLPRLPDEAFEFAVNRVGTFLDVGAGPARQDPREAADSFFRALGLDGERDKRAYGLGVTVFAHLRGVAEDALTQAEADATVCGITLGLLLARATGWEPPIA
jgi:hypothetical protein